MSQTLDAPILVLVEAATDAEPALRSEGPEPAEASLELLSLARGLTSGGVVALSLTPLGPEALTAVARAGATRLLHADPGTSPVLAAVAADAVVAASRLVRPAAVLVTSDYRGKELAGRAAVLLGSACASDVADLSVVDGELRASKLVLSGSWSTTMAVSAQDERTPVVAVRPGTVEASQDLDAAALSVEEIEVTLSPETQAVTLVSRERASTEAGPELSQARTVVVGGRGVNGDFDLVRSLAQPLGAAVGATRVACDEGWIARSAQVGQTGASIAPRLYIGLGVSGAVHHTSGIQGAGTIVAVCDDSEAPIFEMVDFGVVGDVAQVVPQLVEELSRLRD